MPRVLARPTLAALLAALAVLAGAAAAQASATLYAAPDSATTAGPCPQDDPCALQSALDNSYVGDTVILLPGTYHVAGGADLASSPNFYSGRTIEGLPGAPRPTIVQDAAWVNCNCPTIDGNAPTVRHLRIDQSVGGPGGISVSRGATLDDVILEGGAYTYPQGSGPITFRNVVSRRQGLDLGSQNTAVLEHVTIDSDWEALNVRAGMTVEAANSILHGDQRDLRMGLAAGTSASLTVRRSLFRYDPADVYGAGTGTVDVTDHVLSGVPTFVDAAAGDLRVPAGAPTIDAGDAALTTATTDADGLARVSGPAPDMGAYELQAPAGGGGDPAPTGGDPAPTGGDPAPTGGGQPAAAPGAATDPATATTAAAADRVAPRITRVRVRRGRAVRLSFVLSEAARVEVRVGRARTTVTARAGRTAIRLRGALARKVRRGGVRLVLVARDPAGNTAAPRRVRL